MVFDLVALLLIFGSVLWYSEDLRNRLSGEILTATYISIGVALFGLAMMFLLAIRPDQVGANLARYLFFLPERAKEMIRSIVTKFSRGLEFLRDGRAVASVAIQTLLIWVLMGVSNYFVFKAFAFDVPIDAAFVLLVFVSISILLPSSPGFVGVYHFGVVWSLQVYGVSNEQAMSCALVLHAAQYLVVTFMGFYFLRKAHLSFSKLELDSHEDGKD